MADTVNQAFVKFLEAITITDYQKTSHVAARKDRVVENLTAAFPASSDLPFSEARLIGSASKGTIVRPLDDIDVLAIFSNKNSAWQSRYQYDSQAFLYRIRKAYDGLSTAEVGSRGQAVRVFFKTGGHIDVAPVFWASGDNYNLPAGDGSWIVTSPFVANKWFAQKNAALGYHLAPLVRMLKKWNRAHSHRLRSFHLESMAAETFVSLSGNRRTGLQKFFEWGGGHLDVSDPGGHSGTLSSYLSWSSRTEVLESFPVAADRATRAIVAEAAGDHEEAKRLWAIILGSSFPT